MCLLSATFQVGLSFKTSLYITNVDLCLNLSICWFIVYWNDSVMCISSNIFSNATVMSCIAVA